MIKYLIFIFIYFFYVWTWLLELFDGLSSIQVRGPQITQEVMSDYFILIKSFKVRKMKHRKFQNKEEHLIVI